MENFACKNSKIPLFSLRNYLPSKYNVLKCISNVFASPASRTKNVAKVRNYHLSLWLTFSMTFAMFRHYLRQVLHKYMGLHNNESRIRPWLSCQSNLDRFYSIQWPQFLYQNSFKEQLIVGTNTQWPTLFLDGPNLVTIILN